MTPPNTTSAPLPGAQAASEQGDAAPGPALGQAAEDAQREKDAEEAAVGEGPEATPSPS